MTDAPAAAARPLPFGRIALIAAALLAFAAVGVAIWRNRTPPPPPEMPAMPTGGDMRTVVAALEKRMAANPKDGDGWRMLGIAYFETGRYGDATRAYERATGLKPADAALWSALGEARVLAGQGGVNPPAAQAFEKALSLDAKDPRARYFLAVRKDMAGDHKAAIDDWIALLKDTPPGAPWEESVRQVTQDAAAKYKIDIAGRMPARAAPPAMGGAMPGAQAGMMPGAAPGGGDVATDGIPGPTRDQMMAASSLPPGQQEAMVRGMVDGLAARLKGAPNDPDGWIRLMRARMVLGEQADAAGALAAGKAANPAAAVRLDEAAKALGVPDR